MRLAASILIGAGLAACGASRAKPVVVANTAPASPVAAPAVVTLVSLQNGDRACYVGIKTADGTEQSLEGDFELCGGDRAATALIGKRITYTTKKDKVLAASCEGDVDCGKSDEVDLVVTITAAP